jgi:hypothetical protein
MGWAADSFGPDGGEAARPSVASPGSPREFFMRYVVRSVDGAEYGPFTSDELRQLVREQRLGPGDFVRREEGRTWSPFEKIAGLADVVAGDAAPPSRDTPTPSTRSSPMTSAPPDASESSARPSRPRLDPTPERVEFDGASAPPPGGELTIEIDLDSILPPMDAEVAPAESGSTSPPAASSLAGTPSPESTDARRTRASIPVDPARSTNPFVASGLPIDLLEDEEVEFVLVQSFLDACRGSLIGAALGHRGRLVCTTYRAATIMPGFGRSSMTLVWLDRIHAAAVRSRTSVARLIFGVICLLYAAYALVGSLAVGAAMSAIGGGGAAVGGITAILGAVVAAVAGLLGLYLVLAARGRAVIVGDAADGITFACAAAGPWHLARIDAGRMRSIGRPTAIDGRRSSPPAA